MALSENGKPERDEKDLDPATHVPAPGLGRGRARFRQDHGYAWVALCCTTTLMFLTSTIWTSFGVYIVELREQYRAEQGLFAGMFSLFCGVSGATGMVAGGVVNAFSPRVAAIVGCFLISSGYLVGSFSPHPLVLFLSFGLLLGTGITFTNLAATVATQQYFKKRRAFSNGILLTGTALCMFVMPPLTVVLIDEYGWRGSFLLQAGFLLNAVPAALLIRPVPAELRGWGSNNQNAESATSSTEKRGNNNAESAAQRVTPKSACSRGSLFFQRTCGCHLLRRPPFFMLMLGTLLYLLPHQTPALFTVSRAVSLGISRQNAAFIMSAWAITSLCARIGFGLLGDKINRGILLPVCVICVGLVTLASVLCVTLPLQLAYGAAYGLFGAGYSALKTPLMVDVLGVGNLAPAHGVNILFGGLAGIFGSPIASFLIQVTGSYTISFVVSGVCFIVAGLVFIMTVTYERCFKCACRKRRHGDAEYTAVQTQTHSRQSDANDLTEMHASVHSLNSVGV